MSDNDFISTLFPGQGVLYLGWLGPLITPFPCLPLSKLDCSTCIFSSSCMLSCDTSRENRTRPQSGQVSLAEVWAFGWSIRSSLQCFVESDLICSRFEGTHVLFCGSKVASHSRFTADDPSARASFLMPSDDVNGHPVQSGFLSSGHLSTCTLEDGIGAHLIYCKL